MAFVRVMVCTMWLTGCGGLAEYQAAIGFASDVERATSMQDRLQSYAPTRSDLMPETGQAVFDGGAQIGGVLPGDTGRTYIYGDATLLADFGANEITGEISNMTGGRATSSRSGEIFDVGGQLQIGGQDSLIGPDPAENRVTSRNGWMADVAGTMMLPDGAMQVSGNLEGSFVGTRVNNPNTDLPFKGVLGEDREAEGRFEGQAVPLRIEVFAAHDGS